MDTQRPTTADYVAGLRKLADAIEQHPELIAGRVTWAEVYQSFWCDVPSDEKRTRIAAAISAATKTAGKVEKLPVGTDKDAIDLVAWFGPVKISYRVAKAIFCRKVEVQRTVTEYICDEPILAALQGGGQEGGAA